MKTLGIVAIGAVVIAGCGPSIQYHTEAHQLDQIDGRDTFAFHDEAIDVPDGVETHGRNAIRFMETAIERALVSRGLTRVQSDENPELVVDFSIHEIVHHDRVLGGSNAAYFVMAEMDEGSIAVVVHRADTMDVLWTGTAHTELTRQHLPESLVHEAVDGLIAQYPHERATDGSQPEMITAGGEVEATDVPSEGAPPAEEGDVDGGDEPASDEAGDVDA